MDLALNNLQRLICHKTQQAKPTKNLKKKRNSYIQLKDKRKCHFPFFFFCDFQTKHYNEQLFSHLFPQICKR